MEFKKKQSYFKRFVLSYYQIFVIFILLTLLIPSCLLTIINFIQDNQLVLIGENQISRPAEWWVHFKQPIVTLKTLYADKDFFYGYILLQGSVTCWALYRALIVAIQVRPHKVEENSDYGAFGTARWAKKKEILNDTENFTTDIETTNFGSLIGQMLYSKQLLVRKDDSEINGHTMVIAGSGKGKTQAYVLNQVMLTKNKSLLIGDGKGEIYQLTSKQKFKEGFKIIFLDFIKFLGNHWNPLAEMTIDEADNFATNLVKSVDDDSNNVWGGQAINLISACIVFVLENHPKVGQTMAEVRRIINLSEEDIKELFEDLPDDSQAKDYFGEISGVTGNAWSGIKVTATNATRFWKQRRIQNFTSTSDFKFTDLGQEKIAVYIRVHPTDETYRPLVNTFFTQLLNRLIEDVDDFGGTYPNRIKACLDEFTGMGLIKPYQGALAFVRSLGLDLETVVQDISQLDKVYKEEDRQSIISNCDNFIFLGTNSAETAEYISKKLDETTIILQNEQGKSANLDISKGNQAKNQSKRWLMTKGEVLRMKKSIGIYFPSGHYPIKFKKVWAYKLFPGMKKAELNWHLSIKE